MSTTENVETEMQQLVYAGAHRMEVAVAQRPVPGEGEVAIDVAYVGICGTDLHIFHGDMAARVELGRPTGHEMSGTVAALGPGAEGVEVGQAVTVLPVVSCGTCAACHDGHANVCSQLVFLGIDAPGALQRTWVVPADRLVVLDPDLDLQAAALVEPLAVAVHDVRRAEVAEGEQVLVVGGGPVGLLIALVARARGAEVRVSETDDVRRSLAQQMGLKTWDPRAVDVAEEIATWTRGNGVAVAFEVSGVPVGMDTVVASLAVRGRLCLVAIHPQRREVDLHRFFWRELTLVGARLYGREDFEEAAGLVADGSVPVSDLISRVVTLEKGADAFGLLEGGGVMKVLVDCRP